MRIKSVRYSTQKLNTAFHYHDSHQILFITSGSARVKVNNIIYDVSKGSLLIFSRFEEHSVEDVSADYCRYTLLISPELSTVGSDDYILSSVLVNRGENFQNIIRLDKNFECFVSLFEDMLREYDSKGVLTDKKLDHYLYLLLIELYRITPQNFTAGVGIGIVESVQKTFERDYSKAFSLSELADEHHISVSRLSHSFKSVTGFSPFEYLLNCRLNASKNYLANTQIPIKEIVMLCGFSDESNYSRTFKSKVGLTPTEFRKLNFSFENEKDTFGKQKNHFGY